MKLFTSLMLLMLSSSTFAEQDYNQSNAPEIGNIAVANRASSTLSIISALTDQVISTIALPPAEEPAEPMYVVYKENRLYVGDRANNTVVVFDSFSFKHITNIDTGAGVFHMWAAKNAQRLLVNNDIDNTVTVIDTNALTVVSTLLIPSDLVEEGFKPHDVFVTANGLSAFVSLIGTQEDADDYILKYSLTTDKVTARRAVGGDPHLFISPNNRHQLVVTSQETSKVTILNTRNLRVIKQRHLDNAHGVFAVNRRLYVSNISDGGINALNTLDLKKFKPIGTANTPSPAPHNITVTNNGRKIYVTHSGEQNLVSVFETEPLVSTPVFVKQIEVENNPFGLAYIPH